MSESETSQQVWVRAIVAWIADNTGVTQDKVVMGAKLVGEPYNLTYVKVLNMMDHLVEMAHHAGDAGFTLSQNWRLAHRGDTLGDFILAFLEVVNSNHAGRPKRTGIR
jgi:hypothetical protein